MATYKIVSKKHGEFDILLDDQDLELLKSIGGKWNIAKMRKSFYVQKRFSGGKLLQLHRFLLNAEKGDYVDHINHNTLDNRRCNLRVCTNSANLRNGTIRSNNTSGCTGVRFEKSRNKWEVCIKVKYKAIHLGRFTSFDEAVKSRKEAETKYFDV